jgi:hypothetical protein
VKGISAFLLVLAGTSLLAAGGCDQPSPVTARPGSQTQSKRVSTSDDAFPPPGDGRLEKQDVDFYLRVLREAVRLGAVKNPKPGDSANVPLSSLAGEDQGGTPDVAAARKLGLRVEQYLWIRERVLEAGAAESNAQLDRSALADLEASLAELAKRRDSAPDDASRKLIEGQIEVFSAEAGRLKKEASAPVPANIRANIELIRPHQADLVTLQTEVLENQQLLDPLPSPTPAKP